MNKPPDVINFRNLSWFPPLLDTFGLNRHLCIMQKEFVRKFFCPKFLKKRPKVVCPKFFCRNFSVRKFSILMYSCPERVLCECSDTAMVCTAACQLFQNYRLPALWTCRSWEDLSRSFWSIVRSAILFLTLPWIYAYICK